MTAADRKRQHEVIAFWRESAERNMLSAHGIFESGHYDWSLFIAHLAIEKLLKALIVQTDLEPPPIHDLQKLSRLASLDLPTRFQPWLKEIIGFNIEARYDDIKLSFYKKATKAYATQWLTRCEELFIWLKKQFH